MVEKSEWNSTLKVGFITHNIQENLERYKGHFDVILTDKDATFDFLNI